MRIIESDRFIKLSDNQQENSLGGAPAACSNFMVQRVKELVDTGVDLDSAVQSVVGNKVDLQAALKSKVQSLIGDSKGAPTSVPAFQAPWAIPSGR